MNYPGRVIRKGETDTTIMRAIRARLRELQFTLAATGAFDDAVLSAVKNFQSRNVDSAGRVLVSDGKIGPLTWAALFADPVPVVRAVQGALPSEALAIARTQLGVREIPVNSNRGADVEKYLASVGLGGGYAWCAAFVYWCLSEAAKATGQPNPCLKTGGVLKQWQHAKNQRLETVSATAARNDPGLLRPGMVFVIDHGRGLGHTGFISRVQGGLFETIEGNTDGSKTREGGGVYVLQRKVGEINAGYIAYG
ncbi:CHAP domain-containing protein [Arenimonas composti]|uniref:Uncharacterized protein n=1 Tax=Arenimonas composti TR7-09 = DSM 18010 TaxID=1121013 RepID=A0A091B6E0_9GAMM|nr:CHAP domain-containing protein [Arenimonas composti]KFN48233.1 hypothetical protein P873_01365 [Arenimonas composti TR7-09 = DSM 18010]